MKYLVASDYDGTLRQNTTVSTETIKAIKKLQSKGHLFGVVTGRDYTIGFEKFKRENEFPFDFIITNNGASAYDKNGNVYFSQSVNGNMSYGKSTLAQELIKRCLELNPNFCGMSFERKRFDFHHDYPFGENARKYSPHSILKEVHEFVSANTECDTVEQATKVTKVLKEEFGLYLNPIQNGPCIDITPAGVDKSTGIWQLAECLKIPHENIWTAGDNFNDTTMLEKYHGCAMSNGVKTLADVAEYVCDSVADVINIVLEKVK